MSKQREALKIALEVLDSKHNFQSAEWRHMHYQAFQIIREALAEPFDPVQDAAPDLLEALEELVAWHTNSALEHHKIAEITVIAQAAIAKARGQE